MTREITYYLDPSSATGVVLSPGEGRTAVSCVRDLPEHAIELHHFGSHDLAIAFERGVALVSGHSLAAANTVATWRAAGERGGNMVVVAIFNQLRPPGTVLAEVLPVIEHRPSGEEGRIIARHTDESIRHRREEQDARNALVRPLLGALKQGGTPGTYDGNTGHSVSCIAHQGIFYGPVSASVRPASGNGTWLVRVDLAQVHNECLRPEPDARLTEVILAAGAHFDPVSHTARFPPVGDADVSGTVRRAGTMCDGLHAVLKIIFTEQAAEAQQAKMDLQRHNARRRRQANAAGPLSDEEYLRFKEDFIAYRDITHRRESWGSLGSLIFGKMGDSDVHRSRAAAEAAGDAEGVRFAELMLRMTQEDRNRFRHEIRQPGNGKLMLEDDSGTGPASSP